ncbi:MAG TPA: dihydroorotase [Deltaproteobacteria bacterium]|nr:dihydroorotase [Deltaproteobacteria bacterium]
MWIKGGTIFDPENNLQETGDVHIQDGLIAGVYPGGSSPQNGDIIDASGLWVLPGLIDMHVHLRDPGFEYKEDLASGSRAAAAGGVTTLACMANTDPVNDNPSVTNYIIEKAKQVSVVRILPVGAVTKGLKGKELAEMGLMKASGIVAVSDDGQPIEDASILRRALEYAATYKLPLISHCQDRNLSASGVMNEGALSSQLGLPGISAASEDVMVSRDIIVSKCTGIPIHITHISTKGSVQLIKQAKEQGVKVTCDVTPHHLLLTEEAVRTYDTNAKMYPPLRGEEDRLALIEALRDSIIDCIATDHAPHARDEKDLDFDLAPFGMIGLQTLLPAIMKVHLDYGIEFIRLLACVTGYPSRILGIEGGSLSVGSRADITLFDPRPTWTFTQEDVVSKSKNSPFIGQEFVGRVVRTIVKGKTVFSGT